LARAVPRRGELARRPTLEDLDDALNERGISLVFAEMKDPVRPKIERYEPDPHDRPAHLFPALDEAIAAFRTE
jgi:hypothetical protein